jgi:hypothetical protein
LIRGWLKRKPGRLFDRLSDGGKKGGTVFDQAKTEIKQEGTAGRPPPNPQVPQKEKSKATKCLTRGETTCT